MLSKLFNIRHIELSNIKNIYIFFFVVSLVFSRFLVDLFIVVSAIFFIYFKIKNHIKIKSYIFFSLLLFYIYLIINSFFSEVPLESIKSSLPYIRFCFFIFFYSIFFSEKIFLKTLLYSILFVYFLLLVDTIFQINAGYNFFGYTLEGSGRASSFFGRHLILGSFVSKTFSVVIFLIFYLDINKKYFFYLLSVFITAILVYLSKERSSLFFYLFVLFFSFFLIDRKYFLKIVLFVIFKLSLLVFFYPKPLDRLYYHTKSQLFEKSENLIVFSKRHELHYLTAIRIFKDFPILGAGVNSFRHLCYLDKYSVNDVIKNDTNNNVYLKEDGYIYYLENHDIINFKNKYLLIIFQKKYFEANGISSYDSAKILQLIKNNLDTLDTKDFYLYQIYPPYLLMPFNLNNFDLIEKGSILYKSYEFKDGCNTHPHHLFIQILAETGIIGFTFLLIFYLFIIKSLWIRLLKFITIGKNFPDLIIYAYYFTFFFPLMPSGNFFNNYYSILLYLPLTFLVLCQRK
jgi:O-antigen ligase